MIVISAFSRTISSLESCLNFISRFYSIRCTMLSRIALVAASALTLISTSSASALIGKRWDTPLPSCTDFTPYVYAGCFNDPSTPSALIFRAVTLDGQNMTVETCVSFCKGENSGFIILVHLIRACFLQDFQCSCFTNCSY
jgi:hypothetical protein